MTTQQPVAKSNPLLTTAVTVVIIAILVGGPLDQVVFGWLLFPLRMLPKISPDWVAVAIGVIAAISFVIGLHYSVRWFLRETYRGQAVPVEWTWRCSRTVSALICMLFFIGTAIVGTIHQTVWLFTGRPGASSNYSPYERPIFPSMYAAVNQAREAAQRTQMKNHLKQLGLTFHNVASTYSGRFPAGALMTHEGTLLHGWPAMIQGFSDYYMGRDFDYSIPWNQPPNDVKYKCQLSTFVNPSLPGPYFDDEGFGLAHLAGNMHVLQVHTIPAQRPVPDLREPGKSRLSTIDIGSSGMKLAEITDGLANTILIGTVVDGFKPWGHPLNLRDPADGINKSKNSFGGLKQWNGAQFLMCDGTVQMISRDIDPKVLRSMSTPHAED